MIANADPIELKWNIQIDVYERGKRRPWHERTHNIVTNTGRQFIAENITPQSLGPGSFTRHQDSVVRYIGFGIGGDRQSDPAAAASPYADAHPAGYGGTNVQTDTDVTVSGLERPIQVTNDPLWMREITTPGTFPDATRTTFVATFGGSDLNFGTFTSPPLSEIALFKSTANPALPNGSAGTYPGAGGHCVAYDTFNSIQKTGQITIEVRWTWILG